MTLRVAPVRSSRVPHMMNVIDCRRDSIHALPSLHERMFLIMLIQYIHRTNIRTIRTGVSRLPIGKSHFVGETMVLRLSHRDRFNTLDIGVQAV